MSAIKKRLTAAALHALEVISALADKYGGDKGKDAAKVLTAIGAITKSVEAGFASEIPPAEVVAQIEKNVETLLADIAQNDKAADAALDAKFPREEPPTEEPPTTEEPPPTGATDDNPDIDDIDR